MLRALLLPWRLMLAAGLLALLTGGVALEYDRAGKLVGARNSVFALTPSIVPREYGAMFNDEAGAELYDIGDLAEAKTQYGLVDGALGMIADERIKQLEQKNGATQ